VTSLTEAAPVSPGLEYEEWCTLVERGPHEIEALRAGPAASDLVVSAICVGDQSDEFWMRATVESLRAQTHGGWELVACAEAGDEAAAGAIASYPDIADRVVEVEGPVAEALTAGMARASGAFVCLLAPGDQLRCDALHDILTLIETLDADALYTDEDVVAITGQRRAPRFKPPWSPDLLMAMPYVGRLCVFRASLVRELGGFAHGLGELAEPELMLRLAARSERIHHLPGVRFHRRDPLARKRSRPPVEPPGWKRIVRTTLERRSQRATIGAGNLRGSLRIRHPTPAGATVSAIVSAPRSAKVEQLAALGWLGDLGPALSEVILAGPGPTSSRDGVEHGVPARAANLAAERASGDYLLFVDGRCRPHTDCGENWLQEMLGHAARPAVGAVGARVIDAGGRLIAGGLWIDFGLLADIPEAAPGGTARRAVPGGDSSLEHVVVNPGIVGGHAMLIERGLFERVGGFDSAALPGALYDLDLCLRLIEQGYRNVYTPHAVFVLPPARRRPGAGEIAAVWERWWGQLMLFGHYARPPMSLEAPPIEPEMLANLIAAGATP
jgi:hypothetical protein